MNNEIDFLYASDKTGEAVRAVVTGTRTIASTTLEVDSLNNWPAKFVATVGTLNVTTGIIDPATVTIFKGHTSGGDIIIDEFAPDYADSGNSIGQVVVIKPNTFWADTWADIMSVSHNQDGTLKDDVVTPAKRSGGYKIGTIPGSTFSTTGNKTITGVGFTPKLVRFTVVPTTSNTTNITGVGAMDEDGNQFAVLGFMTSSAAARRGFTASCIGFMDTSTTTGMAAVYVSMNADGFTINCTTANGTFDIAYEAFA